MLILNLICALSHNFCEFLLVEYIFMLIKNEKGYKWFINVSNFYYITR